MSNLPRSPKPNRSAISSLAKWIVVCATLALILTVFGRGDHNARRAIIINSDDAGMCSSVNKGTIQALQAGIVKSASIMTCCPGFEEFAEFARSHPQYDYGVHLTLTCDLKQPGWGPVLPKSKVSSLVSGDGDFPASTFEVARAAKLPDVESELRAQIHKAINAGIAISHLDHHMWVLYARPDFLRLYVRLGKEFSLPIRFSRQVSRQRLKSYGEEVLSAYLDQLKELELAGFPILDDIEGDNYSIPPADKRTHYLTNFRNLRTGLTEIVIHCASPDESQIKPPDASARYADTAVFSTNELRDDLSRLRIEVVDWKQFHAKAKMNQRRPLSLVR